MAKIEQVELRKASNFRQNLRRVFDAWAVQTHIAADAGINAVHLARILNADVPNPTIGTMEAISIAMEIPLETLIAKDPSDTDLRISQTISSQKIA